jgi:hypothetical protein
MMKAGSTRAVEQTPTDAHTKSRVRIAAQSDGMPAMIQNPINAL